MPRSRPYLLRRPSQLRVLASTVRQDILDTVQALGPSSVADLARSLGRPADALYYHVRKLQEVGLLVRAGTRGTVRRDETVLDLPGRPLRYGVDPAEPRNRKTLLRSFRALLKGAERDLERSVTGGLSVWRGRKQNTWAGRCRGWLTPEEIREVGEMIERIREIMERRAGRSGVERERLMAFTYSLSPLEVFPARRETAGEATG